MDYIHYKKSFSFTKVELTISQIKANIIEFVHNMTQSDFTQNFDKSAFPDVDFNNEILQNYGFYKTTNGINNKEVVSKDFKNNIFLYFPFFRYEKPAYIHPNADIKMDFPSDFLGESSENIIKSGIIDDIQKWILDIVLDREIYEKKTTNETILTPDGNEQTVEILHGYQGKNTSILKTINSFLTEIYQSSYKNIEYARFAISQKKVRQLSIFVKEFGKEEQKFSPTLAHLSTGEQMVVSLFCSILKEYDSITNNQNANLSEIEGIVIIDEIDLHLHINYQMFILPLLVKQFPKIQFVISTHSPFFVLGLKDSIGNNFDLLQLPAGDLISSEDFSEFQNAYDTFFQTNEQYSKLYKELSVKLSEQTKPLIITEGKTDWMHIKNALDKFQENNEFKQIDVVFHDTEEEYGDAVLQEMCENFSKIQNHRLLIFIFDRDNDKILKKHPTKDLFFNWGNNVFSFCIPVPAHRTQYKNISIEFYYTDEEVNTSDPASGKRLYFSNQIQKCIGNSPGSKMRQLILETPVSSEEFNKKIFDQDCKDFTDANGNKTAFSKTVFAQKIYKHEKPFNSFNLNEFKKILAIIECITKTQSVPQISDS